MAHLDELTHMIVRMEELMADMGDAGQEIPDEMLRELEGYLTKQDDKVSVLGIALHDLEASAEACETRAGLLVERARKLRNRHRSIKDFVAAIMQRNGIKKIEGTQYTFTMVAGRDRVVIGAEHLLPAEMWTEHLSRRLSLRKIEEKLKAGDDVPGARMEQGPPSVRVYQ